MKIDFNKNNDGLVPAIIQDATSKNVLMLGYMNEEAYTKTNKTGLVTFFSRSKNRLWTKGEESGNLLKLVSIKVDCDKDALLISAIPAGPTCHRGTYSCFMVENERNYGFISQLESLISERHQELDNTESYVSYLFREGINKIAQKVGEEAVETVIEAKDTNDNLFLNESADLLFHYLILLKAKGYTFDNVVQILERRNH